MTQPLNQSGTFRGDITSYGLNKADSGAIGVKINVLIHECFGDGEWHDWREYGVEATGTIWIVKKDGRLNERQARDLMACAGWSGDLRSIANGSWDPTPVQVEVSADEYKGETNYRISWLKAYDSMPGGGNLDAGEAAALQQRFGTQLRALAGNGTRNQAPPANGKPRKPAPAAAAPAPPSDVAEDDVPF